MNTKLRLVLILSSSLMLLAGVGLLALTIYRELVEEPQFPEDYHMTPQPTGKYELRSRNPLVTIIGIASIFLGLFFLMVGVTWKS